MAFLIGKFSDVNPEVGKISKLSKWIISSSVTFFIFAQNIDRVCWLRVELHVIFQVYFQHSRHLSKQITITCHVLYLFYSKKHLLCTECH